MKLSNPLQKAKNITLLVLDVDGVLTDGRIYYSNSGDELKAFSIKDGLGLTVAYAASAVREACEFILASRDELTSLEAQYR